MTSSVVPLSAESQWMPTASIEHLTLRAGILEKIRAFFAQRDVLEVETPLMSRYSVTDPHMNAFTVDSPYINGDRFYLQTSPEYAMKRLLAAGSGPIFQLCKAFRRGESSSRHNPEFTMLEWYRPAFNHFQLMDELAELLYPILGFSSHRKIHYRALFQHYLGIDPHQADCQILETIARQHIDVQMHSNYSEDWLSLLMSEVIEPQFASNELTFVYDYPANQAALSTLAIDETGTEVAQRFELYVGPIELANGYFELTDVKEQAKRFQQDQQLRQQQGKEIIAEDAFLLAAMSQAGLPSCSGVALGVDRLVMLALGCHTVEQVLAFPVARA